MKKQYIQPSMKAYTVKTVAILADSNVTYGGSNSSGPKVAEGKGGFFDDEEWD